MSTRLRTARSRPRRDVVALVVGLVLTGLAGAALWHAVTGSLPWALLRSATPLALVLVGGLGLLLTRRR